MLLMTGNPHKLKEFKRLMPLWKWQSFKEWSELNQKGPYPDIEETGDSFAENAIIKAKAGFERTGQVCLADDSGLCVEALGGAPGIRSARYVSGSDQDRYEALLKAMLDVEESKREAAFHCVLAITGLNDRQKNAVLEALPAINLLWKDECLLAFGYCEGYIRRSPFGVGGFGYDPIFNLHDGRSFASISGENKDKFSHRGQALRALMQLSEIFLDS